MLIDERLERSQHGVHSEPAMPECRDAVVAEPGKNTVPILELGSSVVNQHKLDVC
jgi:hypothetical protein